MSRTKIDYGIAFENNQKNNILFYHKKNYANKDTVMGE